MVFSLLLMVLVVLGVMIIDVLIIVNGEVDLVDVEIVVVIFIVLFLFLFIFGIILIILGVIGMFKVFKNKKMSGILLIIGVVISGNIIIFVLWLVSGIKLFINNKFKD